MSALLAFVLATGQAASASAAKSAPDPAAAALIACAPPTYDAAIACLDAHLPETSKRQLAEKDGEMLAHFGLGMFLRNNWRLWQGGPLAESLSARGVGHPDAMSSVILSGFAAKLRGRPYSFDQISRGDEAAKSEEQHVH